MVTTASCSESSRVTSNDTNTIPPGARSTSAAADSRCLTRDRSRAQATDDGQDGGARSDDSAASDRMSGLWPANTRKPEAASRSQSCSPTDVSHDVTSTDRSTGTASTVFLLIFRNKYST